ncbi:MAG TPA: (E)-4-hydroxy-3-methylbut-2-enyl-diphosphate synthase [Chloroflexota bacterium]|nr:(E)-4-hydroxy-3-methylbut-2-enyl-diphosphate synthase [Chloroflexota bacterium]
MTIAERELLKYCASPYARKRRHTRVVMVGDVGVGGDNPIRVQSMTTTRTLDTDATVAQVKRLVDVGCEIVRITAPTVADAKNLGEIRRRLRADGVKVPLVADIHFSPAAALEAALHVEKVRINPGNYADSKTFAVREYSDEQYAAELARIEERFKPVVLRCKERGVAMRIGTNHGSLSDRIMNRFGDTPEGMVESALEFLAICEKYEYYDVIFSMKASNPKVMIQAYRLLAARLDALGKPYPLHLGVTEAGEGEDGRIKSAIGIGSLLEDGLGDTIRVSLTEEPEAEVPVAFAIGSAYPPLPVEEEGRGPRSGAASEPPPFDPFHFERRRADPVRAGSATIGGGEAPRVVVRIPGPLSRDLAPLVVARRLAVPVSRKQPKPDLLAVEIHDAADVAALRALREGLARSGVEQALLARVRGVPAGEVVGLADVVGIGVDAAAGDLPAATYLVEADDPVTLARTLATFPHPVVGALRAEARAGLIHGTRRLAALLDRPIPLLLVAPSGELLEASIALASLLCDGIGDVVEVPTVGDPTRAMRLAFDVLQAAGARVSKTDYVACPSCGRTLFDLQTTTARIKARTDHLTGVKIAIMGCVVNGPGEMADADFGYVGGAPGMVNLYVGKEVVERGVPEVEADDRLIDLIKSHGRWVEPE